MWSTSIPVYLYLGSCTAPFTLAVIVWSAVVLRRLWDGTRPSHPTTAFLGLWWTSALWYIPLNAFLRRWTTPEQRYRLARAYLLDARLAWNRVTFLVDTRHPPVLCPTQGNLHVYFPHSAYTELTVASLCRFYGPNLETHFAASFFTKIPGFLPIIRLLMHGTAATKANVARVLRGPAGKTSTLSLGGITEQFTTKPGCERAVLAGHKGLFRLLLEHGGGLNVSYSFNEVNSRAFPGWCLFPRHVRVLLMMLRAIPRRLPVTVVLRHMCTLAPSSSWTEQDVDALYHRVDAALREIIENGPHAPYLVPVVP
jgi:hypothetical protein